MIEVRFTAKGRADLRDINHYLQTLPESSAFRIRGELRLTLENIRRFPRIGRVNEEQTELAAEPVYRFVSKPYILFYSIEQDHILILGVIHGKRDVDTIMSRRHS